MEQTIYRLALTDIGHNKYQGQERFAEFIVTAESKEEARQIASEEDKIGGELIWKNDILSSCNELIPGRRVMSATFLNSYNLK